MYWIAPLIGGAVAGLLYDFVFAANASVDKTKAFFTQLDYDDSQHAAANAEEKSAAASRAQPA